MTPSNVASHLRSVAVLALVLWASASPALAQPAPLVRMTVEPSVDVVHPGETFDLVVRFAIERHWHIYWIAPGASGMPTDVRVELPEGFRAAPVRYPRPLTFRDPEGTTYGYEKDVALFVPVTAPDDLEGGDIALKVAAHWLVCKGVCRLGDAEESVTLRASAAPPSGERSGDRFESLRKRLPRPVAAGGAVETTFAGGTLTVTGPAGGHAQGALLPIEMPGVDFESATVRIEGGRFHASARVVVKPANALGKPMAVRGVVALGTRLDDPSYEFAIPVPAKDAARQTGGHP